MIYEQYVNENKQDLNMELKKKFYPLQPQLSIVETVEDKSKSILFPVPLQPQLSFINFFTKKGKKTIAEKIYFVLLQKLRRKHGQNPHFFFLTCLKGLFINFKLIKKPSRRNRRFFYLKNLDQIQQIKEVMRFLSRLKFNAKIIYIELLKSRRKKRYSNLKLKQRDYFKFIEKNKFNIKSTKKQKNFSLNPDMFFKKKVKKKFIPKTMFEKEKQLYFLQKQNNIKKIKGK